VVIDLPLRGARSDNGTAQEEGIVDLEAFHALQKQVKNQK
jgi:hypothetical protein